MKRLREEAYENYPSVTFGVRTIHEEIIFEEYILEKLSFKLKHCRLQAVAAVDPFFEQRTDLLQYEIDECLRRMDFLRAQLQPLAPEPVIALAPEPVIALAPEPVIALAPEPVIALAPEPVLSLKEKLNGLINSVNAAPASFGDYPIVANTKSNLSYPEFGAFMHGK